MVNVESWWPLARRMVGWGLVMACLWGWFPFLLGGEIGLLDRLFPNPPTPDELGALDDGSDAFIILDFTLPLVATCIWALGGAITGALAGFFAPPLDSKNPFKSLFFRRVGRGTYWQWFWYNVGISLLYFLFCPPLGQPVWVVYLLCIFAFFVVALWQTLDQVCSLEMRSTRREGA